MRKRMFKLVITGIVGVCLICSVSCRKSDSPANKGEITMEDIGVLNQSRLRWMAIQVSMITSDQTGIEPNQDYMVKALVYGVAADASFERNGYNIDTSHNFITLRRLWKHNYVKESVILDPLDLLAYFNKHPDGSPSVQAVHPDVINGMQQYLDFCQWFANEIKQPLSNEKVDGNKK